MISCMVGVEDHQRALALCPCADLRDNLGVDRAPHERLDPLERRKEPSVRDATLDVDRDDTPVRIDLLQQRRPHEGAPAEVGPAFDDQVGPYLADDLLRCPPSNGCCHVRAEIAVAEHGVPVGPPQLQANCRVMCVFDQQPSVPSTIFGTALALLIVREGPTTAAGISCRCCARPRRAQIRLGATGCRRRGRDAQCSGLAAKSLMIRPSGMPELWALAAAVESMSPTQPRTAGVAAPTAPAEMTTEPATIVAPITARAVRRNVCDMEKPPCSIRTVSRNVLQRRRNTGNTSWIVRPIRSGSSVDACGSTTWSSRSPAAR